MVGFIKYKPTKYFKVSYQDILNTYSQGAPMPSAEQYGWNSAAIPSATPKAPREAVPGNKNKIYNIPIIEAFPGRLLKAKTEGEIGLEIECEGMNLFDAPISYWKTHVDHSLRAHGDHKPIEYVLRKPLSRADIPKALTYLSKKLKEVDSKVDDSTRTSVHVHINCQDMTFKQIVQFICLHTIFEELLVNFAGPDREGNLFCLRAKDAEHFIQILEAALQTDNYSEVFSDNLRYTACNVASIGKFGSLEFRAMRGTVDQQLIQLWIDILLLLRDKSVEYSDPTEIVQEFISLRPQQFFEKIFHHSSAPYKIFQNHPEKHQLMWDGLRLMRDVAYAVKWEKYDPSLVEKKEPSEKGSQSQSNLTIIQVLDSIGPVLHVQDNNGDYWHINYGSTSRIYAWHPVGGEWTIQPRSKHKVNSDGHYMGVSPPVFPEETPPTFF